MSQDPRLSEVEASIRLLENALHKLDAGKLPDSGLKEDYARRLKALKAQRESLVRETRKPAVRPERRRAARAPRTWPVEVSNSSGRRWRGRTVDVSALGMRTRIEGELEVRGLMFVSFTPADSLPVWTRFSLVREISPGEYAIRFLDLPAQNAERLARALASEHHPPSSA